MDTGIHDRTTRTMGARKRIAIALTASALLLALSSAGLLIYSTIFASTAQSKPLKTAVPARPTISADNNQDAAMVSDTARQYMSAFMAHNYNAMWTMLNPQVQQMWPNERSYASFWQARFQDFTLQGYTLGQVSTRSYWVNPETMARYNNVEQQLISLQLKPKRRVAGEPPEDAQPDSLYRNLPFIVQRVAGQNGQDNHWFVLDGGPVDPEAPILPPANPARRIAVVPILMYHHISDQPTTNVIELSLTVKTAMFRQQLSYLKSRGYHSITFNQLFDALYFGAPLPTRPIILTFDDGYEDGYQYAYPLLQQYGYSGMFYIITGKVGWQGQMTWPQLRAMLANGMQMGSHTIHHVDIGQVLLDSRLQAQQELQISKSTMEQHLGIPIQQFCYPSGEPFRHGSLQLQQEVIALVTASGYVGATNDPGMVGPIQSSLSPMVLLRTRVDGRESLPGFMQNLPW